MADALLVAGVALAWMLAPAVIAPTCGPRLGTAGRAGWAALGVLIAAPDLRAAVGAGYPQDSLFTLAPLQQTVVVGMALGLSLAAAALAERVAAMLRPPPAAAWPRRTAHLGAAVSLVWTLYVAAFVVSPQVFYAYYQLIFPGLPAQWVIDPPRQLDRLVDAVALTPGDSIADHGAGVLFWVLWALTARRQLVGVRAAAQRRDAPMAKRPSGPPR